MSPWIPWLSHFQRNARRPLPPIEPTPLSPAVARRVARSLAVFQRGEAGEGRIAKEIYRAELDGIDDIYRRSLELFIAEEGRHARILAEAVSALGGRILGHTWTDRLFVRARRMAGVRFKLLVLMLAEIVGIVFYTAIASALPPGAIRLALQQIIRDEETHLEFHAAFFRTQVTTGLRAAVFSALWFAIGRAASWTVLLDHRRTLRALRISLRETHRAFLTLTAHTRTSVVRPASNEGARACES